LVALFWDTGAVDVCRERPGLSDLVRETTLFSLPKRSLTSLRFEEDPAFSLESFKGFGLAALDRGWLWDKGRGGSVTPLVEETGTAEN